MVALAAIDLGLTVNELLNPQTRNELAASLELFGFTSHQWLEAGKALAWLTRRQTGATASCSSCASPVLWAVTDPERKNMPIDPLPHKDGTILLERIGQAVVARVLHHWELRAYADQPRYRSHFATCPEARAHRVVRKAKATRSSKVCDECGTPLHRFLIEAKMTRHWLCGPIQPDPSKGGHLRGL